jgi:hypothetical protein
MRIGRHINTGREPHTMTTPTDLDGKPYKPTLDYSWMTDAHRATCALHMACDPSQIEYRLDARAAMDAIIIERCEHEDPYGYSRSRY